MNRTRRPPLVAATPASPLQRRPSSVTPEQAVRYRSVLWSLPPGRGRIVSGRGVSVRGCLRVLRAFTVVDQISKSTGGFKMNRREFLQAGAAGLASAATLGGYVAHAAERTEPYRVGLIGTGWY